MKKNLKRTLAKVMAVALTVAMAGTAAPDADAAKKIKLSKSSITVTKGKSSKVTIKNVKKNKVKSLKVKSSKTKVATAKASGKTAVKVTGKKAGSAKVTVTVNVKGQKKATKLTLKVKVTNPSVPTPSDTPATTAPATSAPATSAPATTTPPAGGNQTQTPGGNQTQTPGGTTPPAATTPGGTTPPVVTTPPVTTPPATPPAVPETITLSYDYQFPAARQVKFTQAESGCPAYTINVANFKQVVVTIAATEKLPESDDEYHWTGKITLSSTDEGSGCTAYNEGVSRQFLGDAETDVKYVDGKYVAVFDIANLAYQGAFSAEDLPLIDCISVQLGTDNYDKIKLTEIKLIAEEGTVSGGGVGGEETQTPAPSGSPAPSATPTGTPEVTATPTPTPVPTPIAISLTEDNEGDITYGLDTRRTDLVFNDDGSVTFNSPATSCNCGVQFYLNPTKPEEGVNLANYKYLKLTYETEESAQAFIKVFTPEATSLWDGNLTSDGLFDQNAKTGERTVYIALTTAVKNAEKVGSVLIGINKVASVTIKSASLTITNKEE